MLLRRQSSQTGESWEATVRFSFAEGSGGVLTLGLTATSVSDPTISDTGEATYEVGSKEHPSHPSVMEDETVPGYITVRRTRLYLQNGH